jgi:hypothetical protein
MLYVIYRATPSVNNNICNIAVECGKGSSGEFRHGGAAHTGSKRWYGLKRLMLSKGHGKCGFRGERAFEWA